MNTRWITMDSTLATALCFTVLVLCPLVRGGCQEELMKEQGFMECVLGFGNFFQNIGNEGTDMSNPDAIFEVICSDQGKSAFSCMLKYMKQCPEMTSGSGGQVNPMDALGNIPGFDIQMFMKEGGMDGVCALLVGPCSEVKNCYTMPENGGMAKRDTQPSVNYYTMFSTQANMMCGSLKEQVDCMLKALEKCPASVVDQVEAEFEKAMKVSTPNAYGVTSFQDTKVFIQKECSKLPKDFGQDVCTMNVYASQNFTTCNEAVSMKYSKKRSCAVHDLSKQCISENVKPQCGEEVAMFLARNTHMIFPGTPKDCENNISGSDVKRTSFGILLISTIFTLLHIL